MRYKYNNNQFWNKRDNTYKIPGHQVDEQMKASVSTFRSRRSQNKRVNRSVELTNNKYITNENNPNGIFNDFYRREDERSKQMKLLAESLRDNIDEKKKQFLEDLNRQMKSDQQFVQN